MIWFSLQCTTRCWKCSPASFCSLHYQNDISSATCRTNRSRKRHHRWRSSTARRCKSRYRRFCWIRIRACLHFDNFVDVRGFGDEVDLVIVNFEHCVILLFYSCANKKGRPTKTVSLPYVCRIVNCTKGRIPFSMFVIYRTFFIVVGSHSLSSKSGAIFMVCKSHTPNTLPGWAHRGAPYSRFDSFDSSIRLQSNRVCETS